MVEGAALEKQCAGNRTEGSNPSLSAIVDKRFNGHGRRLQLDPVQDEEIWNHSGEIAIGARKVAALMASTLITNERHTRKIYGHDFTALEETLAP